MVQPIPARFIPAEVLTSIHYIFGQLKVAQTGLMGMLSDTTTNYLDVEEASLARIHHPDKVVNYAPALSLVKHQTHAVCLSKREYIGSQVLARAGYLRLVPYPVQITTSVYEISGTVMWAGRFDFSAFMSEGTNDFFIAYDATLTATLFQNLHIESQAILLNRRFVETLVALKKTPEEVAGV
jgi:hypothetical protein